ncbi:hypothetical protein SAMN05660653_03208 [Desulfonatronum thiosulfatophilum]|uniref:Membrane-anchored ribosome-binding protein, inhibits growth in stationary phase, ElaB/YqjD/DUF883 family n=1 Tax=Desulfonatronum thiosulfatophilum TaxID=617002 RepID=A0A1G6EVR0_9BACT|nr:hypothetical protein [Desulfonatronum thiosulfatophilum]SDB61547.1 hypothetical protein SAMN05660653_03208 [Desulfonatronum thiosulfatophilum]
MDIEKNKFETSSRQGVTGLGDESAEDKGMKERGAEFFAKAERSASDAYDKAEQMAGERYRQVRNYSSEHPGKVVLVAFGIGLAIGYIISASTQHHSRLDDLQRYLR